MIHNRIGRLLVALTLCECVAFAQVSSSSIAESLPLSSSLSSAAVVQAAAAPAAFAGLSSGSSASSGVKHAQVLHVAVLAIAGSTKDFSKEELDAVTSRFETELMNTGKLIVLERRNMDMILQEQGFQQTGACNSSECQVQVGQLLGVDRIITGSITKVEKLYTVNLKMVNVENGQNEMSQAIDIRGTMEDVMRGGCYELAQIFSGLKKPTSEHSVLTAEKASV